MLLDQPTPSSWLVRPTNLKNWLVARSPHSSVNPCHQRLQPTRGPRSAGGTIFTGLCAERTLEATLFLKRRGGAVWHMRSSKDAQLKSKRLQWASEDHREQVSLIIFLICSPDKRPCHWPWLSYCPCLLPKSEAGHEVPEGFFPDRTCPTSVAFVKDHLPNSAMQRA